MQSQARFFDLDKLAAQNIDDLNGIEETLALRDELLSIDLSNEHGMMKMLSTLEKMALSIYKGNLSGLIMLVNYMLSENSIYQPIKKLLLLDIFIAKLTLLHEENPEGNDHLIVNLAVLHRQRKEIAAKISIAKFTHVSDAITIERNYQQHVHAAREGDVVKQEAIIDHVIEGVIESNDLSLYKKMIHLTYFMFESSLWDGLLLYEQMPQDVQTSYQEALRRASYFLAGRYYDYDDIYQAYHYMAMNYHTLGEVKSQYYLVVFSVAVSLLNPAMTWEVKVDYFTKFYHYADQMGDTHSPEGNLLAGMVFFNYGTQIDPNYNYQHAIHFFGKLLNSKNSLERLAAYYIDASHVKQIDTSFLHPAPMLDKPLSSAHADLIELRSVFAHINKHADNGIHPARMSYAAYLFKTAKLIEDLHEKKTQLALAFSYFNAADNGSIMHDNTMGVAIVKSIEAVDKEIRDKESIARFMLERQKEQEKNVRINSPATPRAKRMKYLEGLVDNEKQEARSPITVKNSPQSPKKTSKPKKIVMPILSPHTIKPIRIIDPNHIPKPLLEIFNKINTDGRTFIGGSFVVTLLWGQEHFSDIDMITSVPVSRLYAVIKASLSVSKLKESEYRKGLYYFYIQTENRKIRCEIVVSDTLVKNMDKDLALTIQEKTSQCDFTKNAFLLDISDYAVYHALGEEALKHLEDKSIVMIKDRFDPVLFMRYMNELAKYDHALPYLNKYIEHEGQLVQYTEKDYVNRDFVINDEWRGQIYSHLCKSLSNDHSLRYLKLIEEVGLLARIFPDLKLPENQNDPVRVWMRGRLERTMNQARSTINLQTMIMSVFFIAECIKQFPLSEETTSSASLDAIHAALINWIAKQKVGAKTENQLLSEHIHWIKSECDVLKGMLTGQSLIVTNNASALFVRPRPHLSLIERERRVAPNAASTTTSTTVIAIVPAQRPGFSRTSS